LKEILSQQFERMELKLFNETQYLSKNGKMKIKVENNLKENHLKHDNEKQYSLKEDEKIFEIFQFSKNGKILNSKMSKFLQINEFIKKIEETGFLKNKNQISIIDCGCGISYLSLSFYYFLTHGLNVENVKLMGVDVNSSVIKKAENLSLSLNFNTKFHNSTIQDLQKQQVDEFFEGNPVDMLISLHACNTATDESIAKGIKLNSKMIICAPCCHHELHLNGKDSFLKFGILKNRFEDIMTDTFRCLILKTFGYKTEIFEFISPEHTSKNLMIRAIKSKEFNPIYLKEFYELKKEWNVEKIKLEEFLQEELKNIQ
jgi:2-polyprenyl-3-methyl-5-hydroxy-6-metoxy-1,4-benzoquinol methylase